MGLLEEFDKRLQEKAKKEAEAKVKAGLAKLAVLFGAEGQIYILHQINSEHLEKIVQESVYSEAVRNAVDSLAGGK